MKRHVWFWTLGTFACADDATPEEACARLSAETCAMRRECQPVRASRVIEAQRCLDEGVVVGCTAAETECGQAETYARDASGVLWAFGNTCIPTGFTKVSSPDNLQRCDEQADVRSCETLGIAECKADARCATIDGRPLDAALRCIDEAVPLGCQAREASCPPDILYARGSDGRTYELASGCLPRGFDRISPTNLPAPDWTTCGDVDARCAALGLARCGESVRCGVYRAFRLEVERQCIGEPAAVACVENKPRVCDDAYALLQDAQGQRYWDGTICYFAGVDYVQATWADGTPATAERSWPRCTN